jgi:hypothetical protein
MDTPIQNLDNGIKTFINWLEYTLPQIEVALKSATQNQEKLTEYADKMKTTIKTLKQLKDVSEKIVELEKKENNNITPKIN